MTKPTFAGLQPILRAHRKVFLMGGLIPGALGLFLGETVMAVQFNALQPILGGMTFLTVEFFGAFLVDFPLSVLAGYLVTRRLRTFEARHGALAGAVFLTLFILLVACAGILGQFTTLFDVFGIRAAVLLAAQTARQQLGFHLGIIMVMFLVSDYFLCMLGGTLGFHIMQLIHPCETRQL